MSKCPTNPPTLVIFRAWRAKPHDVIAYFRCTVGFYRPDGKWESESDHHDREQAAARVAYLNGGRG